MSDTSLYRLLSSTTPLVMGIVNVTPDSFYAPSRTEGVAEAVAQAQRMVREGAAVIDVGACSTRPGSQPVAEDEEWQRLLPVLEALHDELPSVPVSVDTFRPSVAHRCVQRFGPLLVNDVSGGEAALPGVPYVLTCPDADPMAFFAQRLPQLAQRGVEEVILDPGFGFGKTIEDNYRILSHLSDLQTFGLPVLVGLSRKSMVYKPLGIKPSEALTGTTVLHTVALQRGASILRVHDVAEAVTAVRLLHLLYNPNTPS